MGTGDGITQIRGTGVPVEGDDIDTDRIIPARYLKEITFTNMGRYAFFDERFDESGKARPHPMNDPGFDGAAILVVNKNFGCGSSREHAPQAIIRRGIRAIIGESFAEIFAGNCMVLGVPTVTAGEGEVRDLMASIRETPKMELCVDLPEKRVSYNGKKIAVRISDVVWSALTEGTWDSTRLMLANLDLVRQTAQRIPYLADDRK